MNKQPFGMTNQQAADILKDVARQVTVVIARGNTKSIKSVEYIIALDKAIQALENMPGRKNNE